MTDLRLLLRGNSNGRRQRRQQHRRLLASATSIVFGVLTLNASASEVKFYPKPTIVAAAPVFPKPYWQPSLPKEPKGLIRKAPRMRRPLASQPHIPHAAPVSISKFGLPALALQAYRQAAKDRQRIAPRCHMTWMLLAAIGKVESDHGGGRFDPAGTSLSPILGPALRGQSGVTVILDTDKGSLDGDAVWDRAVGPMQFIPATWERSATSPRGREADPQNIFDAAATASAYLCAHRRDLGEPGLLDQAILSYNNSDSYLQEVLSWNLRYSFGKVYMQHQRAPINPTWRAKNGNANASIHRITLRPVPDVNAKAPVRSAPTSESSLARQASPSPTPTPSANPTLDFPAPPASEPSAPLKAKPATIQEPSVSSSGLTAQNSSPTPQVSPATSREEFTSTPATPGASPTNTLPPTAVQVPFSSPVSVSPHAADHQPVRSSSLETSTPWPAADRLP